LWTINNENTMKWCISKGVDGVITDDPKKYLRVLKDYTGEKVRLTVQMLASVVWINVLMAIFGPFLQRRGRSLTKKERRTGRKL